jgi:hypothetical protein
MIHLTTCSIQIKGHQVGYEERIRLNDLEKQELWIEEEDNYPDDFIF